MREQKSGNSKRLLVAINIAIFLLIAIEVIFVGFAIAVYNVLPRGGGNDNTSNLHNITSSYFCDCAIGRL